MKVNSTNKGDISFNGFWNNKALKKVLAFAEKDGALFTATTAFAFSAGVRPLIILATPYTDKENKEIACAKSIMSNITEIGLTFLISKHFVNAIDAITKNPKKYLTAETIQNLKGNAKTLGDSKIHSFASQIFKLGLGLAVAAPKAILTALGMPYVFEYLFEKKEKKNNEQSSKNINSTNPTFKANEKNTLAKGIAKILNNKHFQDFVKENKDSNFPMHIIAAKDALTTGVFIQQTQQNKKIDEKRKPPLIYNAIISTSLSIASGYLVDKMLDKPAEKFLNKFKKANANDPNLKKYVRGFKIAKPVFIMATIYYMFIPLISTFLADRIGKDKQKSTSKGMLSV